MQVHLKQDGSWLMDPWAGTSLSARQGGSCKGQQENPSDYYTTVCSKPQPCAFIASSFIRWGTSSLVNAKLGVGGRETGMNNAVGTWLTFYDAFPTERKLDNNTQTHYSQFSCEVKKSVFGPECSSYLFYFFLLMKKINVNSLKSTLNLPSLNLYTLIWWFSL